MINPTVKIRTRLSRRAIYSIILLIIFGIALALRVSLAYDSVFTGDWVRFAENDPWYHIRLVENLIQHFPHRIVFDPFTLYPYGQEVPFAPFFDLLLGSFIWVIGLGSPTQHTLETFGPYFPAILGALVTVPVYFIGRELFNRNVGLLSAALIAILPGQFLWRSLLGFTDHHIAEVLFSTTAALFLILAVKRAKEKEISFNHIRRRDWGNLKKPLIYALLSGLTLGIYLTTWIGGLLFVSVIVAYIVIQYIINHLKGKSTDYLCIIGVPMFFTASIIVIPFLSSLSSGSLIIASLIVSMLIPIVFSGTSRLMHYKNLKRTYYPVALVVLGVVGIALLYVIEPSLYHAAVSKFRQVFMPSGTGQTVGEVLPLLSIDGAPLTVVYFGTSFFIAVVALGMLIYSEIKGRKFEGTLTFFIVWSLIILLATLAQNRFAYYFAVNVALLSGYLCWKVLVWSWEEFKEALPEGEKRKVTQGDKPGISMRESLNAKYIWKTVKNIIWFLVIGKRTGTGGGEPGRSAKSKVKTAYTGMAAMMMLVFLVLFVPSIGFAIKDGGDISGPNEAWHSSLVWMREYTPDPFEDPDFYYELYDKPPSGEAYDYPESAYGVMNWWDYGHWITRIAHRIPSANPFQAGASKTAAFFIAQDESSANEVLDELGSKYVIIDYEMATVKFNSMAKWAGESESQFSEAYERDPAEGRSGLITLYYPEYYQSINSRLYNFGGEAVVPHNSTWVISWEERTVFLSTFNQITSSQIFTTYEEAQEFVDSQAESNYRIVGLDPFTSPVPLEKLENYQLAHGSDPEVLTGKKVDPIPYVKIFEYLP